MFVIKADIEQFEVEQETFIVETRSSLIALFQMLEQNKSCLRYSIFDSVEFQQIKDLKQRLNISNQSFTKFQS